MLNDNATILLSMDALSKHRKWFNEQGILVRMKAFLLEKRQRSRLKDHTSTNTQCVKVGQTLVNVLTTFRQIRTPVGLFFFPIIANCENFVQDHDNFFFVIFHDQLCLCTLNLRSPLLLTRNFVEGEAIGKEGNNLICFNMEQNYRCEKRLLTLNFLFQHFK